MCAMHIALMPAVMASEFVEFGEQKTVKPKVKDQVEFVEEHTTDTTLGSPTQILSPNPTNKTFHLKQGLLKNNLESLTAEFKPDYQVVWQVKAPLVQYTAMTLSGNSYEEILEQVVKQFYVGACIRANMVVEIYDIVNNKYYCED